MAIKKHISPWFIGIAAAALLSGALALLTPPEYVGSDDAPILRSFMGYEGGEPAHYHLILHTVFAWLLRGLALLLPGVAWFSILQLFLLWFSCAVIVKSAAACARNHGLPLLAGAAAGVVFLLVFALYALCRITFTTTAALVGAAAVAQLFGVDYQNGSNRQILRGMLLSIALLVCCHALRQISVLPPLAFCVMALAVLWLQNFHHAAGSNAARTGETPARVKRTAKPMYMGILVCALCFGLLAGIRAMEVHTLRLDDYLAWHDARINLMDYTSFEKNYHSEETLRVGAEFGLSQPELKLIANWFFIDSNVSTEALQALYAVQPEANLSLMQRLVAAPDIIAGFFSANPAYALGCGLIAALALLCVIACLLRRRKAPWLWWAALLGVVLCAVLMVYLAAQGRLPARAAATVLFPAGAFLLLLSFLCLAPTGAGGASPWRTSPIVLLCVLCLVLAGASAQKTIELIFPPAVPDSDIYEFVPSDLDEYALREPEMLFIYDLSLVGDSRMFPNTEEGIPGNTMFWGGYPARSPSWNHQLAVYGIDGTAFTAHDFLRENVAVASTDGHPWESLLAYIEADTGLQIDWGFYGELGYVGFFQIYGY